MGVDADGVLGKREPLTTNGWKSQQVEPLWKSAGRFPEKVQTELLYDPALSLLGMYSEDPMAMIAAYLCSLLS